jgi:hypothetical protein
MLELLSRFWTRELCKSLEVRRIKRYSILGYLRPAPDDVQRKQLVLIGVQLDVELTQSCNDLSHILKMLANRFQLEQ